MLSTHVGRDVTKISSQRINTTNRQGIKQLEISFWFHFFFHVHNSQRSPRLLILGFMHVVIAHTDQFHVILRTMVLVLFPLPHESGDDLIFMSH